MWSPSFGVLILGLLAAKLLQQHSLAPADCAQAGGLLLRPPPAAATCSQQRGSMQFDNLSHCQGSNSDRADVHSHHNGADSGPLPRAADEFCVKRPEEGASVYAQSTHHQLTSTASHLHQSSS